MADLLHALAGIAGLVALAWLMSENRRAVPWRAIVVGLGLQVLLGVVLLRFSPVKTAFLKINDALLVLERATQAGTSLVFGYLGGGPAPSRSATRHRTSCSPSARCRLCFSSARSRRCCSTGACCRRWCAASPGCSSA